MLTFSRPMLIPYLTSRSIIATTEGNSKYLGMHSPFNKASVPWISEATQRQPRGKVNIRLRAREIRQIDSARRGCIHVGPLPGRRALVTARPFLSDTPYIPYRAYRTARGVGIHTPLSVSHTICIQGVSYRGLGLCTWQLYRSGSHVYLITAAHTRIHRKPRW
jgi:hypothetical protein